MPQDGPSDDADKAAVPDPGQWSPLLPGIFLWLAPLGKSHEGVLMSESSRYHEAEQQNRALWDEISPVLGKASWEFHLNESEE